MATDQLSRTLTALADPTRRALLARLAEGEATVNELAEPFDLSLPAVSKHLKVLKRAGLITQGRRAQWRPCRLDPTPLNDVAEWLQQYRRHWEESLDRLDGYLQELQSAEQASAQGEQPRVQKYQDSGELRAAGERRGDSGVGPPVRAQAERRDPPVTRQ